MSELPRTSFHQWLVELRRHFHQYPELGYQEKQTGRKICEVLGEFEIPYHTGIGKTGIVARLETPNPEPVTAFRADMDALPLEEANDVPYRSRRSGMMHACGHDGHITIALGTIRYLLESGWKKREHGSILFIFQPAEEGGAGAKAMLDSGFFDPYPIQAVFAGHVNPEYPVGTVKMAPGAGNAASDTISIELKGHGGHGAHPHLCKDVIVIAAQLINQMQALISRELPPLDSAVLTVGQFQAGTAPNIIPEAALLRGTLRTLNDDTRTRIVNRLEALVDALSRAHGISAELQVIPGYPLLVNDSQMVRFCELSAKELLGQEKVQPDHPRMGAEDFAYFLQRWPGVLIGLGCRDPEKPFEYGLHSPHFDLDERVLDVGVRLFAKLLTDRLDKSC